MKIYEYNKIKYSEVEVKSLTEIEGGLLTKMNNIRKDLKDDGACVYNATLPAKTGDGECIEGFVICMGAGFPGAIRHCWNKIGDNYFDVTKEFIWSETRPSATFYYFPLAAFSPGQFGSQGYGELQLH